MRLRCALLLLLAWLVACNRTETAPPERAETAHAAPAEVLATYVDEDRGNLLDMVNGSSVIYRTAELDLEHSAVHAIDGMATTRWASPVGGAAQTFVASLSAASRIDQLGVVTGTSAAQTPSQVRFESSIDGVSWRDVFVMRPAGKEGRQVKAVPPFESRFLRVSTIEPEEQDMALRSVIAIGKEVAVTAVPSFSGCWTINGVDGQIVQRGERISGVIGGETATAIDGAIDGRVARLMWVRGPMWGYAAMTIAPDAKTISALTFHQDILIGNAGAAWFGERCRSSLQIDPATPVSFLRRAGRWSMFGLRFTPAGAIDPQASAATLDAAAAAIASAAPDMRFRVVSREYREATAERNREVSALRLGSLRNALAGRGVDLSRIELVAAGSQSDSIESNFAVMRLLASRVDLEIVR